MRESSCEEIDTMDFPDNGFMTGEFQKALVQTAIRVCKECSNIEILEFIRCDMLFTPQVQDVTVMKEDFTRDGCDELLHALSLDDEKDRESLMLSVIIPENP